MKGRYLLFAACLSCLAFHGARSDDDTSVARAASRRVAGNSSAGNTTQSRQKASSVEVTNRPSASSSRSTPTTKTSTNSSRTISSRTTITPRTTQSNTLQPRATTTSARTPISTTTRAALPSRTTSTSTTRTTTQRQAAPLRNRTAESSTLARAATNNDLRNAIMGRDYKSCRQVYYECMDEFCANKDAQLKRCACSSRLHEFDKVKKQLSNVEDKLLDFNQRLLTVNMEKEDADALFKATEGELAFNKKDTSASKKVLNEISKKLNSSANDSFTQNLSAISLSLNTDAAFDSVDSLKGVAATAKEGVELYNAALPVCREMASEVCDEDALSLAESGYQMTIEQDCNTVSKAYETQTDKAREKIREGSALLDISRLDIYQKRNSDDILTCKKKMLNQLYNTSVCGSNLDKCLDMSGQYIDPSTGQAFLTLNLANLSNLITRPTGGQTWTSAPGNDRFVSYLNSKKKYLEPAMENCQDIADFVWTEFIDDALSQIKLAQESKLEEVRQSCTTLNAQCLSNTAKSISDFDARALSTFGVKADKTVNDMCASVRSACTALLETTGGATDWVGGMSQISTDKTYETIMQTCREVGRACIIQACKSISGNFGMCESTQNSINRKAIINRTSCWSEVQMCVAEAGEEAITNIFKTVETDTPNFANGGSFYEELYGADFEDLKFSNPNMSTIEENKDKVGTYCYQNSQEQESGQNCIYDICLNECGCGNEYIQDQKQTSSCTKATSFDCRVCRLAEKIWGNCEALPAANIELDTAHNKILIPKDSNVSTLLSWFAQNTGTADQNDSCRDTTCPSGYHARLDSTNNNIICTSDDEYVDGGYFCPTIYERFKPLGTGKGDCCRTGNRDANNSPEAGEMAGDGNCCIGSSSTITTAPTYGTKGDSFSVCNNISDAKTYNVVGSIEMDGQTFNLVCLSSEAPKGENITTTYPSGQTIKCEGQYVLVDSNGYHIDPHSEQSFMSYIDTSGNVCQYDQDTKKWLKPDASECEPEPNIWMINLSGTPIGS